LATSGDAARTLLESGQSERAKVIAQYQASLRQAGRMPGHVGGQIGLCEMPVDIEKQVDVLQQPLIGCKWISVASAGSALP